MNTFLNCNGRSEEDFDLVQVVDAVCSDHEAM